MTLDFRSDCPGVRPPGVQPCQGACPTRLAPPESSGGGMGKLDPEERESEEEEEDESDEPDHQVRF